METQGVHRQKNRNDKTHKMGEHNYRRDWEAHGNLSTVTGDQPWQEYDDRQSSGLAGRQRLPGPEHEETHTHTHKKRTAGNSVVLRVCKVTGTLLGNGETPVEPRAQRCHQGTAAPAAVRIQHRTSST